MSPTPLLVHGVGSRVEETGKALVLLVLTVKWESVTNHTSRNVITTALGFTQKDGGH